MNSEDPRLGSDHALSGIEQVINKYASIFNAARQESRPRTISSRGVTTGIDALFFAAGLAEALVLFCDWQRR
ncbi:MAG: hypothetical protein ACYTHJ_04965 [Planctomycetota bacterium]|jgi:hypothetical protein